MKILKRRYDSQDRYFGVHIGDRRLAGCLPETVHNELNRQWEFLSKIEPTYPKLNFTGKMKIAQQAEWFQVANKSRDEFLRHSKIAIYAEENALELFLAYAALCTHLSQSETEKRVSTRSRQLALSILLPLVSVPFPPFLFVCRCIIGIAYRLVSFYTIP